ncbi:MAG: RNA chaperone Hfq [Acidobacteriaceae bacterium]|nr:RNA chaperone Hfq [Acidobacteriaceae bacterium]
MRIWKRRQKTPSGETGQEALYLKSLSERQVPVQIKLRDGEVVSGWIEYFDDMMLRLTREGKPNLFIYKSQIRTITESVAQGLKRSGNREEPVAAR